MPRAEPAWFFSRTPSESASCGCWKIDRRGLTAAESPGLPAPQARAWQAKGQQRASPAGMRTIPALPGGAQNSGVLRKRPSQFRCLLAMIMVAATAASRCAEPTHAARAASSATAPSGAKPIGVRRCAPKAMRFVGAAGAKRRCRNRRLNGAIEPNAPARPRADRDLARPSRANNTFACFPPQCGDQEPEVARISHRR